MKKLTKNLMINIHATWCFILRHFTLSKLLGGLITALLIGALKYYIFGGFHIEYSEYLNNVTLAFLGWTLNTVIIGLLTEFFEIKGINFNLEQLIFGLPKMKMDLGSTENKVENLKPKLYQAMDSSDISQATYVSPDGITSERDNTLQDKSEKKVELTPVTPVEPYRAAWYRAFPNLDPNSIFFPVKINPGPGFNVPGGEVPIRDEICKHLDYNRHLLNQLKNMDLETALDQKNNNILFMNVLENKLNYAKDALGKIPAIPRSEHEFNLKNKILSDLEKLNKDKLRAEARTTLITSRIEFIEGKIHNKEL